MQAAVNDTQELLKTNSRLTFDDYVIQKIVSLCAQDVDGLLGMDGNVVDSISETFGRDERVSKGIKVDVGEEQVSVDVTGILAYDVDAREVFTTLQQRVSNAIERMTGLQLIALNLNVTDIMTRREWQKANT
ncbi:Asp23/Gls24 family envelope stress response protein [Lacticaseibacillus saniviri]|uniref:Stress response regulator gls24 homolog n=1 Tax=Lacticaseibacillus saniviri JCM 17471 = DSM 24301 TaxID=1293598 RepID=A0A0R2MWM4_9LACO|nr:Asp23/Gls24 family envelope stress response protein [Lacticaseibacillus saniviri]KRO17849.1 hypothetical protein IV56_GL001976 [Lacticaseibacillus saniviri JCM 17471 = DSM 24301]MCG4282750.1 Asp23/Gls24 family envelope stress response protein [Lacticaseibacillus saniviri]